MRFACGDMRDHIVSYQNDHRPSYWRRRALRHQARLRIDFSEILRVVRFSTFATISANIGSGQSHSSAVSARAISALQGVPRRRFVGSDWQARLKEASLVALAVDFALVVLGGEVDGHREIRLTLQDLCRVRGG